MGRPRFLRCDCLWRTGSHDRPLQLWLQHLDVPATQHADHAFATTLRARGKDPPESVSSDYSLARLRRNPRRNPGCGETHEEGPGAEVQEDDDFFPFEEHEITLSVVVRGLVEFGARFPDPPLGSEPSPAFQIGRSEREGRPGVRRDHLASRHGSEGGRSQALKRPYTPLQNGVEWVPASVNTRPAPRCTDLELSFAAWPSALLSTTVRQQ